MTPVATAGTGISIGTVALVGGVIAIAGVAYLLYKKNDNTNSSKETITKIISDDDKYIRDKRVVIDAIEEKDWDMLEALLKDKNFKRYPDLIKMAKEALDQK